MSVERFLARLDGLQRVALDAGVFAVHLAGSERWAPLTLPLFERIEQGRLSATTSALTLMELLVKPYEAKNEALAKDIAYLLPTFPNLHLEPVTAAIADRAALWQAREGLAAGKALQAASASLSGAQAFLTLEGGWGQVARDLELLILEDCL